MKSEILKVPNPFNRSNIRTEYFTKLHLKINKQKIQITAKVDTGAAYTVFGYETIQNFIGLENYIKVNGKPEKHNAYDATDTPLDLIGIVVDDFYLTKDIKIDKILIYFSERLKHKAVLGMDILSLFDFQYLQEPNQLVGTFWINNYEQSLQRYTKHIENNDYLNPRGIMTLDNILNPKEINLDENTRYIDYFDTYHK